MRARGRRLRQASLRKWRQRSVVRSTWDSRLLILAAVVEGVGGGGGDLDHLVNHLFEASRHTASYVWTRAESDHIWLNRARERIGIARSARRLSRSRRKGAD